MEEDLFVQAPVSKAYFKFTLPLVFSLIVGLIYNMADTYFIGHTANPNAVAAVSLCGPIFAALNAIGGVISLGGSTAISRLFGENKNKEAAHIGSFCFNVTFIVGCICGIIMLVFSSGILKLIGADEFTFKYAFSYYKIIAVGAPFIFFSVGVPSILRTEGLAKEVMIGSMIGTIINIILDPIFITLLNQGVQGAAIATVIGNIISDVFCIYIIFKKSRKFTLSIKSLFIGLEELKGILSIGIPGSLQSAFESFAAVVTNLALYSYGNNEIAAMGITKKLIMIVIMIIVGFSFGMQPLIGYNYGAKNIKRLKEILKFSIIFEVSLSIIISALLFVGSDFIIKCFMNNSDIINSGGNMLRLQVLSVPLISIIFISTVMFQSAGKALSALILSVSHQGIIFVPVILTMKKLFGYYGVIGVQPVTDVLSIILAMFLFYKKFRNIFFEHKL